MTASTRPRQAEVAAYVAERPAGVRAAEVATRLGVAESVARTYLAGR